MAGRKDKNIVDYFPHYCKSGKTLFILESKYGNDGYAVLFKIFELLGSNDNHYIDCRTLEDWEYLQAKMKIDEEKLNNILECLSNLEVIHKELWENKIIWSSNFIKNISDVYLRRRQKCMQFYELCQHLFIKCKHKYNEYGIIDNINTQSKVKESKVKEINAEINLHAEIKNEKNDEEEISNEFKYIFSDSLKDKFAIEIINFYQIEQNDKTTICEITKYTNKISNTDILRFKRKFETYKEYFSIEENKKYMPGLASFLEGKWFLTDWNFKLAHYKKQTKSAKEKESDY